MESQAKTAWDILWTMASWHYWTGELSWPPPYSASSDEKIFVCLELMRNCWYRRGGGGRGGGGGGGRGGGGGGGRVI